MEENNLDRIAADARKLQRATEDTLASLTPWLSWNVRVSQGRQLGEQLIQLSGLVAELADQINNFSPRAIK